MKIPRREFITLLGGTVAAWPRAARAQQQAMPVIGFIGASSPELIANQLRAFHQGLSETDHIEGRNIAIEYRWAEGHNDRLPALAADLVRRQVSVITTPGSTPAALAAKAATGTIPIVFESGADPIAVGLVGSLNRPGRNATGVVSMNVELGPKRLELLHEVVPRTTTMAVLINPANPLGETLLIELQEPARNLGLQLHALRANTEHDFETIFTTLRQLRAGGLVIATDIFFTTQSERIAALALRHAVPTIYQNREFPAAGGLMSYGGSITDLYRQVGVYTGRILKGEKPADMPVQQSTKVELIINLKTATALGITIPISLLGRADEVIE